MFKKCLLLLSIYLLTLLKKFHIYNLNAAKELYWFYNGVCLHFPFWSTLRYSLSEVECLLCGYLKLMFRNSLKLKIEHSCYFILCLEIFLVKNNSINYRKLYYRKIYHRTQRFIINFKFKHWIFIVYYYVFN